MSSPGSKMQIVFATSNDSRYPAKNMFDGKTDTFWVSTGLYPQSFVVSFGILTEVTTIQFHCYNVKELSIEKTMKEDPVEFEEVYQTVIDQTEGTVQKKSITLDSQEARFFKFTIKSGFDHFCAVKKLIIS